MCLDMETRQEEIESEEEEKMKQKQLRFTVDGQEIRARPVTVVADSRNYLVAEFVFSGDWEGLEKTAVFEQASGVVYHVLVQDGTCTVPAEVIQVPWFRVSVFGGDRLTTNRVEVSVCQSGFLPGVTPPAPTPDIYDQLLRSVAAEREQAAASADAAEADRQAVAAERIETETLAGQAGAAAKSAGDAASAAAGQARTAETAAGRAQDAAARAESAAEKTDAYTKTEADGRFAAMVSGQAGGVPAYYRDALESEAFRRAAVLGETVETGFDDKLSSNPYTFAGISPSLLTVRRQQEQLTPYAAAQTAAGVTLLPGAGGQVALEGTASEAAVFAAPSGDLETGEYILSSNGRLPAGVTLSLIGQAEESLAQIGAGQAQAAFRLEQAVQAHVQLRVEAGTAVAWTACLSLTWAAVQPDISCPVPVSTPLYGMPGGPRDEWDAVPGLETRRCRLIEPGDDSEIAVSEDPEIASALLGFNLTVPHRHTGDPEADVLCTHFVSKSTGSTIEDITFSLDQSRIQLRMRTRILSLYGYKASDPSTALPAFRSWMTAQKTEGTPLQLVVVMPEETALPHPAQALYPLGGNGVVQADEGKVELRYSRDLDAVLDRYASAIETAGGVLSV